MNSVSLSVSVPFCSLRKPYARDFLETERFPPPATVYGFLLAFVGEEDRYAYSETRIAIALLKKPEISLVLRTKWRRKTKEPAGIGKNRIPDYQEVLSGLEFGVWIADGPLAQRIRICREAPQSINRFGGLSLGESRDLIDAIQFGPQWAGNGLWLSRDNEGEQPLPIWVDHVGSKGTRWEQFRCVEAPLIEPSLEDARWITIRPL